MFFPQMKCALWVISASPRISSFTHEKTLLRARALIIIIIVNPQQHMCTMYCGIERGEYSEDRKGSQQEEGEKADQSRVRYPRDKQNENKMAEDSEEPSKIVVLRRLGTGVFGLLGGTRWIFTRLPRSNSNWAQSKCLGDKRPVIHLNPCNYGRFLGVRTMELSFSCLSVGLSTRRVIVIS